MEIGSLSMTTPNFDAMTVAELRAYAIAHREDMEVLRVLLSRRDPNGPKYNFPDTEEGWAQTKAVFQGLPQLFQGSSGVSQGD
jgi:hypothetical protein